MRRRRDKPTIFFSNPKVSSNKLLSPHFQQTAKRIKASNSKYILAIQDGMRLNYTSHLAKTDIGRIGKAKGKDQYGLIQHSTLCVTDQNEPLGLMDVQHFHYDEFKTSVHHHHRELQNKASYCWVQALCSMRERLGKTDKNIITVADREGDFFEFLHKLREAKEAFVIRSLHDRYTGTDHRHRGGKIRSLLANAPEQGITSVEIQDVKTREIKRITLKLKAIRVTLPPPNKSKEEKCEILYRPIEVNVLRAYSGEYEWTILTSLPIDTQEDLEEIIQIYRSRWHIEDYHKILKTGYQVDEIYLHQSRDTIENLLAMASISACRLYWIIYVGRVEPSIMADQLFEEFEWKALYVYFEEEIPETCPPLVDVILKIARLGGYKPNKKAKPPGVKTIWIGYQQFTIAAKMYYRALSMKT